MAKTILFVCTENSARSQIAEGFFNLYNKNLEYIGISAGTNPSGSIKDNAIIVMKEKGIDITNQKSKLLTPDMTDKADRIFTMGCIKGCPVTPPEKTIDWDLEDPKSIEKFREIRDKIEIKVKELIDEI